jgi:hypothetical protein
MPTAAIILAEISALNHTREDNRTSVAEEHGYIGVAALIGRMTPEPILEPRSARNSRLLLVGLDSNLASKVQISMKKGNAVHN